MADALSQFLRADAARPFVWGVRDCGLRLADWVLVRRGIDPAADVRGTYASADELAVLMGRGGLPLFVARLARRARLPLTADPARGDIAVVARPGGKPLGAIKLGNGFSILADGGVAMIRSPRVIGAWMVRDDA